MLTQQRIVDAARDLLQENGYTATTIVSVAQRAGVAVPTVYRTFGNKAAIVKRLYDVTLAGDDADVPLAERPEFLAIHAALTLQEKLRRYADLAATVAARLRPVMVPLMSAAQAGDTDIRALVADIENERLIGMKNFGATLSPFGVDPSYATDVLWVFTSPDLHHRLVHERAWPEPRYRAWLADTLFQQLCPESVMPTPSPGAADLWDDNELVGSIATTGDVAASASESPPA